MTSSSGSIFWWRTAALCWAVQIFLASTNNFNSDETRSWLAHLLAQCSIVIPAWLFGWIHLLVRKSAHAVEYGILAILVYHSYAPAAFRRGVFGQPALNTFFICAFYALTDEVHQIFVDSRTASLADWSIDLFGALLAILALQKSYSARSLGTTARA